MDMELTPQNFISEMEKIIKKMVVENFDVVDDASLSTKMLMEVLPPEKQTPMLDFYFIVYQNDKHVMFGKLEINEENMSINITPMFVDAFLLRKDINKDKSIITFS